MKYNLPIHLSYGAVPTLGLRFGWVLKKYRRELIKRGTLKFTHFVQLYSNITEISLHMTLGNQSHSLTRSLILHSLTDAQLLYIHLYNKYKCMCLLCRDFIAYAASQAGDADHSRVPGLNPYVRVPFMNYYQCTFLSVTMAMNNLSRVTKKWPLHVA